jgi:hypothetical protein
MFTQNYSISAISLNLLRALFDEFHFEDLDFDLFEALKERLLCNIFPLELTNKTQNFESF